MISKYSRDSTQIHIQGLIFYYRKIFKILQNHFQIFLDMELLNLYDFVILFWRCYHASKEDARSRDHLHAARHG